MTPPPAPSADTASSLARPFEMLIDGQWRSAIGGGVLEVVNPADGAVIATIPSGGPDDIDDAVAAARRGFEDRRWIGMTPGVRARVLWKVADLIDARATEFAELETLDNGKPISAARVMDVPAAAAAFRYWAGWCSRPTGETHVVDLPGEYLAYTVREPVGVVALITPWNFPLVMASAKLAPALAAGCAIVLKPAEQTSLTALRLGEVLMEAGVPAGVVNVVTGLGRAAGAALANHPDVDKISFTGSTLVGKDLVGAARGNLKRLTLELGGKSPTLILADADLSKAIPAAANGIFRNAGQMCAAGSRLFVERSRFEEVVAGVVAHAGSLRIGPGMDPATTLGPLVSRVQHERVLGYIDSARQEGATLMTGGGAPGGAGYFVEPTVVIDARPDMRVVREEIFGPVLVATPVDDVDNLAVLANDTEFGLSAGIWTRDVAAAQRLARRLKAGTVTINTGMVTGPNLPFGGFKQSGWGREGGAQGIEAYLESKTVVTAL